MVLSFGSFFEVFLSVCAAEKSGMRKVQTEATHGAVTPRPAAASRGRRGRPRGREEAPPGGEELGEGAPPVHAASEHANPPHVRCAGGR